MSTEALAETLGQSINTLIGSPEELLARIEEFAWPRWAALADAVHRYRSPALLGVHVVSIRRSGGRSPGMGLWRKLRLTRASIGPAASGRKLRAGVRSSW
jgi:hypothetical protein